jgi:RimJ/RimL family protein N-acetyltransferase
MNINLRKWKTDDIDSLVLFANNVNISKNLADGFPYPYLRDYGIDFIQRVSADNPTKIFAICLEELAIGSIGIFPKTDIHRKNAEIAYWIAEPYWGQGIAKKAIELITQYAFNTFDISRIYAKPFGNNKISHSVLEKVGFKLEAVLKDSIFKNDDYIDEFTYTYSLKDFKQRI